MNKPPIISQQEADQVKAYLVKETAKALSIPEDEAERRVEGLLKSGILEMGGGPACRHTQKTINAFLSIPSTAYAHFS